MSKEELMNTIDEALKAEENTREQVQKVKSHPWIPNIPISGFVFDVHTGKLREVAA